MLRNAQHLTARKTANPFIASALLAVGALCVAVVAGAFQLRCARGAALSIGAAHFCVETAASPLAWQRGLSERASLGERNGMLFIFPQEASSRTFWMKGMQFPLDMIWIRDHHVVGFESHIVADGGARLIATPSVDEVLEVNAGAVDRWSIRVGDVVSH